MGHREGPREGSRPGTPTTVSSPDSQDSNSLQFPDGDREDYVTRPLTVQCSSEHLPEYTTPRLRRTGLGVLVTVLGRGACPSGTLGLGLVDRCGEGPRIGSL